MATSLAPLLDAWNEAHRELNIALEGTPDADLWVRPHPKLLSIGELVGHIMYWQTLWVLGDGYESPLADPAFRYYTDSVNEVTTKLLTLDALTIEVARLRVEVMSQIQTQQLDTPYPGQLGTWGNLVQYQAFHVAYHTGQVYSVRHLLGHTPEDN